MSLSLRQGVSDHAGHQGDRYAEVSKSGNEAGKRLVRWILKGEGKLASFAIGGSLLERDAMELRWSARAWHHCLSLY